MKNKTWLSTFLLATSLLGTAQAALVSSINWSGSLTISGFGAQGVNNADGNPTTMTLHFDIADGSSHTIGSGSTGSEVTGNFTITNLLAGNDLVLSPDLVLDIPGLFTTVGGTATSLLPAGTTNFPTGFTSPINLSNNPIFSTTVSNTTSPNISSNLDITRLLFDGNIFEQDITESSALGSNSLSQSFNAFDQIFGDGNGTITRDFTFQVDVSSAPVSQVPVPAAVWLFLSGFMGMLTMRKKVAS